jgi:hypothetical protein
MPTTSDKNQNQSTLQSTSENKSPQVSKSTSDIDFQKMKVEDVYILSREFVKGLTVVFY